jgi:hypothetical protein
MPQRPVTGIALLFVLLYYLYSQRTQRLTEMSMGNRLWTKGGWRVKPITSRNLWTECLDVVGAARLYGRPQPVRDSFTFWPYLYPIVLPSSKCFHFLSQSSISTACPSFPFSFYTAAFPWRCRLLEYYAMWLLITDVSEDRIASIIRLTRMGG